YLIEKAVEGRLRRLSSGGASAWNRLVRADQGRGYPVAVQGRGRERWVLACRHALLLPAENARVSERGVAVLGEPGPHPFRRQSRRAPVLVLARTIPVVLAVLNGTQEVLGHESTQRLARGEAALVVELEVDAAVDAALARFRRCLLETRKRPGDPRQAIRADGKMVLLTELGR